MRLDKNRIAGSAKQVEGKIKEGAGKLAGDAKLKANGKAKQTEGRVQNAVGGLMDALKAR